VLDGVYRTTEGVPVFHTVHAPTTTELQALLLRIIKRLMKFLTRKGFLIEEQGISHLDDSDPDRALGPLRAAACTYRIALGPRAGQKVLTLQTVPSQAAPPTQQRCVNAHGFSLHAEICCAADQRKKLEHLCRYITRPAIANERLTLNRAGDVVLQLKSPYHDGTTARGSSMRTADCFAAVWIALESTGPSLRSSPSQSTASSSLLRSSGSSVVSASASRLRADPSKASPLGPAGIPIRPYRGTQITSQ
jgi:hypothetical protein